MNANRRTETTTTGARRELTAEARLGVLLEVARRSRGTLDLEETLDHLLDAVATFLDYDAAGIFALLWSSAGDLPPGGARRVDYWLEVDNGGRTLRYGDAGQPLRVPVE